MKKRLFTSFLFLFLFVSMSFAQSSKFFKDHGYVINGGVIPKKVNTVNRPFYTYGIGYIANLRYNVISLSDNMSIGLNVSPIFDLESSYNNSSSGLSGDVNTYGAIYLPVQVSLNLGAGSTYDTDGNYGIGISAGIVPAYTSMFGDKVDEKFSLTPCAEFAFRRFKDGDNALRQFAVRYDHYTKGDGFLPDEDRRTFHVTASWTKFMDY